MVFYVPGPAKAKIQRCNIALNRKGLEMKLTQHQSEVDSEGRKVLRFTPDEWETLSKAVTLLKDIYEHLDGGAALYPGSLIFEEDNCAVAVIGTFLRKVEEIPARP